MTRRRCVRERKQINKARRMFRWFFKKTACRMINQVTEAISDLLLYYGDLIETELKDYESYIKP